MCPTETAPGATGPRPRSTAGRWPTRATGWAPCGSTSRPAAVLFVDNALQIVEQLVDIADIGANTFTLKVPTHGVAAVRVPL